MLSAVLKSDTAIQTSIQSINTISKQLKLDFEKYSNQYNNIMLKTFKNSHDKFLIIDKNEIYHIATSLKDLGKKWFDFSKINLRYQNYRRTKITPIKDNI